jgi:hypothetical protein
MNDLISIDKGVLLFFEGGRTTHDNGKYARGQ